MRSNRVAARKRPARGHPRNGPWTRICIVLYTCVLDTHSLLKCHSKDLLWRKDYYASISRRSESISVLVLSCLLWTYLKDFSHSVSVKILPLGGYNTQSKATGDWQGQGNNTAKVASVVVVAYRDCCNSDGARIVSYFLYWLANKFEQPPNYQGT